MNDKQPVWPRSTGDTKGALNRLGVVLLSVLILALAFAYPWLSEVLPGALGAAREWLMGGN